MGGWVGGWETYLPTAFLLLGFAKLFLLAATLAFAVGGRGWVGGWVRGGMDGFSAVCRCIRGWVGGWVGGTYRSLSTFCFSMVSLRARVARC